MLIVISLVVLGIVIARIALAAARTTTVAARRTVYLGTAGDIVPRGMYFPSKS